VRPSNLTLVDVPVNIYKGSYLCKKDAHACRVCLSGRKAWLECTAGSLVQLETADWPGGTVDNFRAVLIRSWEGTLPAVQQPPIYISSMQVISYLDLYYTIEELSARIMKACLEQLTLPLPSLCSVKLVGSYLYLLRRASG
jgi:hypothetical protein